MYPLSTKAAHKNSIDFGAKNSAVYLILDLVSRATKDAARANESVCLNLVPTLVY